MQIILLERVENLGGIGDLVSVRDGYGRNFLLPQKKALRANDANRQVFEANRERLEAENAERRSEAEAEGVKVDGAEHLEVIGKTFRYTGPRPVPISHELFRDLKDYAARARGGPDAPLFQTKGRTKKTGQYETLTSDGIGQMIAGLCAEIDAGLTAAGRGTFRRVGPQRFRRAFASRMSRHMDQGILAQIMGTSSKVLDEFYIDRSPRDIHRATMAAKAAADAADNE